MSNPFAEKSLKIFSCLFWLGTSATYLLNGHYFISSLEKRWSHNESFYLFFALIGLFIACAVSTFIKPRIYKNALYLVTTILFYVIVQNTLQVTNPQNPIYQQWAMTPAFWVAAILTLSCFVDAAVSLVTIQSALVYPFFAAGVCKLMAPDPWWNGYTLAYYFMQRSVALGSFHLIEILNNLTLMKFFSITLLTAELISPLALFNRKANYFFAVATFSFLSISYVILDIRWLKYNWMIYLIFPITYYYSRSVKEARP